MKMEKITNNEEVDKVKDYWFPLHKGCNRLLIVINCLIIIYTVNEYSEKVNTFLFTLFIELVVYIVSVWVYRGFKEPSKDKKEKH